MSKKSVLDVDINEVRRLYQEEGLSGIKIAKILNTTLNCVYKIMKLNNIEARSKKDAQTKTIKLSEDQIKEIYRLYDIGGMNDNKIAKQLNIKVQGVRKTLVKRGKRTIGESKVLSHKANTIELTHIQKQLILGSLLGDGCLYHRTNVKHGGFSFIENHGEKQKDYLQHKANILNTNIHKEYYADNNIFNPGGIYYRMNFNNKYELEKIYKIINHNNRKTPNELWISELEASAIAYWFLDDGWSSYRKNDGSVIVSISSCSFTYDENLLLVSRLLDFGVKASVEKQKAYWNGEKKFYWGISIRSGSISKFMDLIEPTVLQIPSMMYKIKRRTKK